MNKVKEKITVAQWMDEMNEEDVLKYIICFLYHYDVGTERFQEENFDDKIWSQTREMSLKYFEDRLAYILKNKAIVAWYKEQV